MDKKDFSENNKARSNLNEWSFSHLFIYFEKDHEKYQKVLEKVMEIHGILLH